MFYIILADEILFLKASLFIETFIRLVYYIKLNDHQQKGNKLIENISELLASWFLLSNPEGINKET